MTTQSLVILFAAERFLCARHNCLVTSNVIAVAEPGAAFIKDARVTYFAARSFIKQEFYTP